MNALTTDQFKKCLPDKMKKSVNQELIDKVNSTLSNPDMYENYRDNLLSYSHVMSDGRFKLTSYIDAVKYVSYKLMGGTNLQCYTQTFPDKIQRFTVQGIAGKDIASYVSAYNKSKLVNLILEQSLVPTWVLNQDMYQKALNTQAELMISARSEKVRSDAANSILTHLKRPETQKIELDVGIKKDSTIDALRQATMELVRQQREGVQAGVTNAQDVAHSSVLIEGELEEAE
jgi:hypothetical protein